MTADDSVLAAVRAVAAIIVVVLVLAVIVLYFMPGETERFWAWTINPEMTALLMGAGYAAGGYFFTRTLMARSWRSITLGFLPITAFTTLLLIATAMHWDRFNHGHVAFQSWAFLYIVTPVLVPALWLANRRTDPGPESGEQWIPGAAWAALVVAGALITLLALVMFIAPDAVMDDWPWALTELTARVVSAYLALTGISLVQIAIDARWRAGKVLLESLILGFGLIVIGTVRAWDDLAPAAVRWSYLVSMIVGLTLLLGLYLWMERREPAAQSRPTESRG